MDSEEIIFNDNMSGAVAQKVMDFCWLFFSVRSFWCFCKSHLENVKAYSLLFQTTISKLCCTVVQENEHKRKL